MVRTLLALLALGGTACSLLNREGLDVTCEQLGNGARNACRDGIITSCIEGEVTYRVCEEEKVCEETWQAKNAFKCRQFEALELRDPEPPAFPSKEPTFFDACGWSFETRTCAECVESKCCAAATACAIDLDCSDCAGRGAAEAQCTSDPLGLLEPFRNCHERCDCG